LTPTKRRGEKGIREKEAVVFLSRRHSGRVQWSLWRLLVSKTKRKRAWKEGDTKKPAQREGEAGKGRGDTKEHPLGVGDEKKLGEQKKANHNGEGKERAKSS